ncbi:MAG TPA: branched-chain amino acid ABC transporter ATP-binding protein/permease, partial [Egibacteraceae bacterium]|nr:branched-chain amino acid ABC transporter ATP-binding protein/permease [Egibacteraceae bacterium]
LPRGKAGALLVLAAFAILPPLLGRLGVLTDFRAVMLGFGACYAAMALSLNVLMGYAGQISLGHAALIGAGAYASGILTGRAGLPMLAGVVVAALVGAAAAFLVGLPALRLRGLYLAITTIGFAVAMEQAVFRLPWVSGGSAGVSLPRPAAGAFVFTRNPDYLALVLVFVLGFWLLDGNITRSKLGRAFQGLRENEQVAQAYGVDVSRYKLLAFVISGALAGVSGALYGHLLLFVESRNFSFLFSLTLVTFVVVGGLGSRVGVVVAAALFGIVPRMLTVFEGWDLVIGSALLVFTMARHPTGFAGALREAREKKAAEHARAVQGGGPAAEGAVPAFTHAAGARLAAADAGSAGREVVLAVRDVRVRFGGLVAVDGAGLEVPKGRIVGLIGPNGAGKTTLFNAISGFVAAESGSVSLRGRELAGLPPHERALLGLGRTFQTAGLARGLSLLDNVMLAQHRLLGYATAPALLRTGGVARAERDLEARSREVVAALGMTAHADLPLKHLSGGQQRIAELACALVTDPEVLLLDEPSAGMAPAAVEQLAERLRELRDDLGRTVLLIEHHIPLVMDVCDEVVVLNLGQVLAAGGPDEVVRDQAVLDAYLGAGFAAKTKAAEVAP